MEIERLIGRGERSRKLIVEALGVPEGQ